MEKDQKAGVEYLRVASKRLPNKPGVYHMLSAKGDILYVGKARNLKHRVTSYTRLNSLHPRTARMVSQVQGLEITTTGSEAEALLLEANLIKHYRPPFNILLKDDKSFPYIEISAANAKDSLGYPRLRKYRGKRQAGAHYFGPFASAGAVNQAINVLQKAFLLRPCANSYFKNRTRPCMEYEIKRCSAPCVGYISEEEYAQLVEQAVQFLEGKNDDVQQSLSTQMEDASARMDYEQAAKLRDRIRALTTIRQDQTINSANIQDADILAVASVGPLACVQVFFIRGGRITGTRAFFPSQTEGATDPEILEAFLSRFYQNHPPPPEIYLSHDVYGRDVLQEALSTLRENQVKLHFPQRGEKRAMVENALRNAREALDRKQQEDASQQDLLRQLAELMGVSQEIQRIEVFDNSHVFGKHAVGAMIVAGPEGFMKHAYRKFTVQPGDKTTGGDDYSMMREVLTRRYGRIAKNQTARENNTHETDATWPSLVLIDGGAAHLAIAEQVFKELGIMDIPMACIAKGPDRNAGQETFHQPGKPPFSLDSNHPLLYYLQRLRDEAHRFAITTHRAKRQKALNRSVLDDIPGVGPARKKALIRHFGSAREVSSANQKDLQAVPGISAALAEHIYRHLHRE